MGETAQVLQFAVSSSDQIGLKIIDLILFK
jgi:hypothetical protein